MKFKTSLLLLLLILSALTSLPQAKQKQTGTLFIIGGGSRSQELMQSLVNTAQLNKNDYIVVLPMSGEEPDTSYFYISADLRKVCTNTIANLNFTKEKINDKIWLDSVQNAKLIFITGGDQNRFMEIVLHTPVQEAIQKAYASGSTIAGTSAGAAMMSKKMITGNELSGDSVRSGSFKSIRYNLVEVKEGLGLLSTAVIDQHFIARSRYNRLLSVLAANPTYPCIGIDEETAIIVKGKKVTVVGDGQVITLTLPQPVLRSIKERSLVNLRNIQMNILTKGDVFYLK
ncbi:MAG: cyanophycinase [Ferruginibacter sp.]